MNNERNILDKLSLVHPRMLTENVLLNDCRMDDSTVTLTGLRDAVRKLEAKGQVVQVQGEDALRIKITDAGKARLAE
jgi:hypothetical protein